jgi:anti-sigma regulatory factor (Ser/Thr protein kinase)
MLPEGAAGRMITATYPITGGDYAAAGAATRSLKEQLKKLGVEPEVLRRIMIASYEAEMNVVIHARKGNLWVRLNQGRIDLEVVDEGPGISDIELAMKAGYSTASPRARQLGFGAGMGLPNIRKASDLFELDSRVGRGTRVRSAIYLKRLAAAETLQNSLVVREGRCRSCLACLAACPTRALRLRDGRPIILQHLCIDCSACLAACRCGALSLKQDAEEQPALTVAEGSVLVLPLPFLNGFPQAGPETLRRALSALGFRELRLTEEWEAALAQAALRYAREEAARRPVISPVCPAAVNLIETHFPSLIPQLAPFLSPVEAARDEHSLRPMAVVVSCPSQATALHPGSLPGRLQILSPVRLAEALRPLPAGGPTPAGGSPPRESGKVIPGAAIPEGVLRVTGVRHVQRVLEKAEAGVLEEIELLEPYFCDQGCWGSPLLPEDPFLSRYRASLAPGPLEGREAAGAGSASGQAAEPAHALRRVRPFLPRSGMRLDEDMLTAMRKLARIDELARALPGRDCGLCGAPTCACLAEDIVTGRFPDAGCPVLEDKQ